MEVTIDIDKIIESDEKDMLMEILDCESEQELKNEVIGIIEAAVNEYFEMILGKQLPTRANEIKERRLFHLLKHYFVGRIPTESEVSSLFQLTGTRSSTLLRNVKTKFRFELKKEIKNTIRNVLQKVKYQNEEYRVTILNKCIREEIKDTVSAEAPHLNQIRKVNKSASLYKIPDDSLEVLCEYYDLDFDSIKSKAKDD